MPRKTDTVTRCNQGVCCSMQLLALIGIQRCTGGSRYSGTGLSDLSVKTGIGNEPTDNRLRDCPAVGRGFQSNNTAI